VLTRISLILCSLALAGAASAAPPSGKGKGQESKGPQRHSVVVATKLTFRGDTCPLPASYTPIGVASEGQMRVDFGSQQTLDLDLPSASAYFTAPISATVHEGGALTYLGPLRLHLPEGNTDIDTDAALQGSVGDRQFVLAGPLRVGTQCAIDITFEGTR
jgi:hypothetical protein